MDGTRFDQLVRKLLGGESRRALLRLGVVPVAGALAGLGLGDDTSEARKKKRKKKKRKKRKNRKNRGKVNTVSVACLEAESAEIFTGYQRAAQTFLAPQSGNVTMATVYLSDTPEGLTVDFEVRDVDAEGAPADILGSSSVSDIPATSDSESRPVTVTFSPPVPVSAGQRYALAVVAPIPVGYLWNGDSECPDQFSFSDEDAVDPWDEDAEFYGLVFSLTVATT